MIEVLEKWTRLHSVDEHFKLAQLMRFPWAPVQSLHEILNCPQLAARRFFVEDELKGSRIPVKCPGTPYKISGADRSPARSAPSPGGHNDLIYRQTLGMSREILKRLDEKNVI